MHARRAAAARRLSAAPVFGAPERRGEVRAAGEAARAATRLADLLRAAPARAALESVFALRRTRRLVTATAIAIAVACVSSRRGRARDRRQHCCRRAENRAATEWQCDRAGHAPAARHLAAGAFHAPLRGHQRRPLPPGELLCHFLARTADPSCC